MESLSLSLSLFVCVCVCMCVCVGLAWLWFVSVWCGVGIVPATLCMHHVRARMCMCAHVPVGLFGEGSILTGVHTPTKENKKKQNTSDNCFISHGQAYNTDPYGVLHSLIDSRLNGTRSGCLPIHIIPAAAREHNYRGRRTLLP